MRFAFLIHIGMVELPVGFFVLRNSVHLRFRVSDSLGYGIAATSPPAFNHSSCKLKLKSAVVSSHMCPPIGFTFSTDVTKASLQQHQWRKSISTW